MIVLESNKINNLYAGALRALKTDGEKRADGTIELLNVSFVLTNPRDRHITSSLLKHNLDYVKREIMWYFMGTRDPAFVAQQAKLWDAIKDEKGEVNSNYGKYLFGDGFIKGGEMEKVIAELQKPDSRRAVAFIVTPEAYNGINTTKDMPCTAVLQFFNRNGVLDLTVYMRSNDLVYGWRNDVPFFTLLQEMVAAVLGASLGTYTHISGSLHIYPKHQWLLDEVANDRWDVESVAFPEAKAEDYIYFAYKDFVYADAKTELQKFIVEPLREIKTAMFKLQ